MVNYILSFCRITAASRIFSRNFYLPLLKPLTPKDALRTFRITGKWLLGAKTQHYIPVLLNHAKKRQKTNKNYGKLVHEPMEGYSYMIPILDPENESHKLLLEVLETKEGPEGFFVYTVDDKKCNIILTAPLEFAIRDGQIVDVMVSQRNDRILVKLANFKKIGVDMESFGEDDVVLYAGEGATSPEDEKCHHHGKFTMSIAKIFEDKEREAEEWELELQKIINRKRKSRLERTKEYREMLKIAIKNLDWNKFEEDAKKVVDQIGEPVVEHHIGMEVYDLEKTRKANQVLEAHGINILPTLSEIPDVVNAMSSAYLDELTAEIDDDEGNKVTHKVSGVRVKLPSGKECFIVGQMVKTDDGDVFVPGQTIETEFGLEYSPGFTVNVDNQPTLIKGLIMGENQNENEQKPMFLPTESTITSDGQLTFATNTEERVKYKPKKRPKKKKQQKELEVIPVEDENDESQEKLDENIVKVEIEIEHTPQSIEELQEIILMVNEMPDDVDDMLSSSEDSKTESEISHDDTESEGNSTNTVERMEFEELLKELLDDGMDDLINNIEDKKATLQQKLEELRKLKLAQNNNNIATFASIQDTLNIAKSLTENGENQLRIAETLLVLLRRIANFRDRHTIFEENLDIPGENSDNEKLIQSLKKAVFNANEILKKRPRDQITALKSIGDELQCGNSPADDLAELSKTPMERDELANEVMKQLTKTNSKTLIFRSLIQESDPSLACKKICDILEDPGSSLPNGLSKLAKDNSKFVEDLLSEIKSKSSRLRNEKTIVEALRNCLVSSTITWANNELKKMDETLDSDFLTDFLTDSKSLAIALGLPDVANNLDEMLNDPDVELFSANIQTQSVMKKVCLLKKLCGKDFTSKRTLQKLRDNPERSRNDPILRDTIREVASLMSQASPLKNSKDLPLQHLKTQNMLALEEYLAQRITTDLPVMICKKDLQAIVPKEAAKSVSSGRSPYLIVDESGISQFKPKHMLSALRKNLPDDYSSKASKVERERSQSPFYSSAATNKPGSRSSRSSSPQIESKSRKFLKSGRMVA